MTEPSFIIVIPVHNEAGFMEPALEMIHSQLSAVTGAYRIILVENGSTDRTYPEAARLAAADRRLEVIRLPQADYGLAVRAGMEQAAAQTAEAGPSAGGGRAAHRTWAVLFDIDYFSGPFVGKVIELADQADAVIGSKLAPGARDGRPPIRRLATRVFNLLLRVMTGSRLSDTHGIKAVRIEAVRPLLPSVASAADLFDTELMLRAERAGRRIVEVPTAVEELRASRSSILRRVPRTLRGLAALRRRLRALPPPERPGRPRPEG